MCPRYLSRGRPLPHLQVLKVYHHVYSIRRFDMITRPSAAAVLLLDKFDSVANCIQSSHPTEYIMFSNLTRTKRVHISP